MDSLKERKKVIITNVNRYKIRLMGFETHQAIMLMFRGAKGIFRRLEQIKDTE